MKAVGNYVIIKIEEQETESGILTKATNEGKVIDCQCDPTLNGKIVTFNPKLEYTSMNDLMFIPHEQIYAVRSV